MYPQLPCLREYFALEGIADKHINNQQLQLRQDAGGTGNITDATKEANNLNDFAGGALVSEMNRLKARLGLTGSFHINSLIRQACDEAVYGYGFTFEGDRFLPATVPHRIENGFAYGVGDRSRLPVIGLGLLGDGAATLTFPFDLVASDVIKAIIDSVEATEPFARDDANDRITLPSPKKIWGIKVETSGGFLRGFYQCSEGEGLTVFDRSGNNNHATLSTVSVLASDETFGSFNNEIGYTKAIRFSPTDEFTDFGTSANASVGGTAKRTFKVKLVSFSFSTTQVYWSIFQVVGNNRAFQFGIDVLGNPFIVLSEDGTAGTTNSYFATNLTATINTNIELQVVFLPSDSVIFTLNGQSQTVSIVESGIFASSTDSLKQGSDIVSFDQMNAIIYESSILDENDNIIIEPDFNQALTGTTQNTRGSANPIGTLTGGAAIIFLPLAEDTDLAVFGLLPTGLPNIPVAQRLKMTDGIAPKFTTANQDNGNMVLNSSYELSGTFISVKMKLSNTAGIEVLFDTRRNEGGGLNGVFVFFNSAILNMDLYELGSLKKNYIFSGVTANETEYNFDFDLSGAVDWVVVKRRTDIIIPFSDIQALTPNKATDDAIGTSMTVFRIIIGSREDGAFDLDANLADFKFNGLVLPMHEGSGDSQTTDFSETCVWTNKLASAFWDGVRIDIVSYYAETNNANSGFSAGASTDQVRINLAAISAGSIFDVEILNVDFKTADQGYLFQTLTGSAYRLFIDTDSSVFYEVDDTGLVDSGYNHVDKDSYKLLFNNGAISLEVNGVEQATDTSTATTLTQGILMVYNASGGTISLRGTSKGFNIDEIGVRVATWRGEIEIETREGIVLTNYAGLRMFFSPNDLGKDKYGDIIDITTMPDTGLELDGTFDSTPELNGATDTMITDIDLDFTYINSDVNPNGFLKDLLFFLLTTQSGFPAGERAKILTFTNNNP